MATYFSEIGKSISNVLTKDLKLSDKITINSTANGTKSETLISTNTSSLSNKTTISRDVVDGIKADIVLDANVKTVLATLTATDVILNGMKVELKTGDVCKIGALKANVLEKRARNMQPEALGSSVKWRYHRQTRYL